MKWKRAKMKLSDNTISVLKNYSTINQNLMINMGSTLSTMSAMKNIVAKATVEETFEKDVAIYDLNEFLGCLTQDTMDLNFQDHSMIMIDSEGDPLEYFYSDPSVVTTVSKAIELPKCEVNFTLPTEQLSKAIRRANGIGAPDMKLKNGHLTFTDKKNDTANSYSMKVFEDTSGADYEFWFKVENLKLMSGTYEVSVSSKKISHFKNTNADLEYFIALEPESYYG